MLSVFLGNIYEFTNSDNNSAEPLEVIRWEDIFLTCHIYHTNQPIFFYKKETRRSINIVTMTSNSFVNGLFTIATSCNSTVQIVWHCAPQRPSFTWNRFIRQPHYLWRQMTVVLSNSLGLKEKGQQGSRDTAMCNPVTGTTLNNLKTKTERS